MKEWWHTIQRFNRNIRLFMLANVFIQIGMGVFSVMYNLYIRELGMPETINGSVIAIMSLATAIILVPAGIISDKIGRKSVLVVGTVLTAFTLAARSVVSDDTSMLVFAFITGFIWAFVQVSGIPFLAENSSSKERVHLFSVHFSLVTVASVVGNLLGGVFADGFMWLTSMNSVESIRASLLIGVVLFALGVFPLLKLQRAEERETVQLGEQKRQETQSAAFADNVKLIALFAFAQLLIGTGSGLVIPYLNLYFANRFDASNSYVGLILALGSAMTAVAMLIGPAVVKRVGKVNALILFQLLSIPFLFLTAFTTSLFWASVGFLLRQALMNAGNPIQSAIAMDIVSDRYKGLANSVNQMVFNLGWATMGLPAAWLVTNFGSYWGYAYAFSITGGLYLTASIYFYIVFGRRWQRKRGAI
ncbi:MFS transporter [Caryophanon latum]|uniref:Multidrug transporter n=1 Tax=Caryophanon latum TaxID=33977 RepID=A0A1C0YFR2_9BACL|nr:MFS transporter [Caryophanon latum]OCS86018.1 multidrug transporter [Caryophanon latum]